MTGRRVYGTTFDMSGETVGTLRVGQLASRQPLRYRVRCIDCGTESTAAYDALRRGSATCLSSLCGPSALREQVELTPRKFRERAEAAERKKQGEQDAIRAESRRKAEEELTGTAREIGKLLRERIANGKDDEAFVSPDVATASMSHDDAAKFNAEQAALFIRSCPEYAAFRSQETFAAIGAYFKRNGLQIITSAMIRAAFERLRDYGLLTENPKEASIQERPREPSQPAPSRRDVPETPELPAGSQLGYDLTSGEQKVYSKREIDAMDSLTYRRVFRIYNEHLALPDRNW